MSVDGCCLGCGLPYGWQQVHNGLYRHGNDATAREERDTGTWTLWTKDHGVVDGFESAQIAMLAANEVFAGEGWPVAAK